jgi:hypothetical protein
MTAWLDIVKKHAKANPGKSLREFLPEAKAEYAKLKKSGKVNSGSMNHSKSGKRSRKHSGGSNLASSASDLAGSVGSLAGSVVSDVTKVTGDVVSGVGNVASGVVSTVGQGLTQARATLKGGKRRRRRASSRKSRSKSRSKSKSKSRSRAGGRKSRHRRSGKKH